MKNKNTNKVQGKIKNKNVEFNDLIYKIEKEETLKTLSDYIEISLKDNIIHIKFKKNVIIESDNMFIYNKGYFAHKAKQIYLNPILNIKKFKEYFVENMNKAIYMLKDSVKKESEKISQSKEEKELRWYFT